MDGPPFPAEHLQQMSPASAVEVRGRVDVVDDAAAAAAAPAAPAAPALVGHLTYMPSGRLAPQPRAPRTSFASKARRAVSNALPCFRAFPHCIFVTFCAFCSNTVYFCDVLCMLHEERSRTRQQEFEMMYMQVIRCSSSEKV